MEYEFHTMLPVQRRESSAIEHLWVVAMLEWDVKRSSPRVTEFGCDDEDIINFWNSDGGMAIELAIIDDAMKLHYMDHRPGARMH